MLTILWTGIVLFAYAQNPDAVLTLLSDNWILFVAITIYSATIKLPTINLTLRHKGSAEVVHADASKLRMPMNVAPQKPAAADQQQKERLGFSGMEDAHE